MRKVNCEICNSGKNTILCKNRDYRDSLSRESFSLVKCSRCGLIYLNPRPFKKDLHKFYSGKYYCSSFGLIEEKLIKHLSNQKILSLVEIKKTGKLLDIGCGPGTFLLQMKNRGYDVCGVDISSQACRIARRKKLKIYSGELKRHRFPSKSFDIVTLWHVFEHLYNPSDTLKEIRRILKDDGILIMETPNINCFSFEIFRGYHFHLDSPRHLYHWTQNSMKLILNKNGFFVCKTEYPTLNYPLCSFHSFKNFLVSHNFPDKLIPLAIVMALPLLTAITVLSQTIPSKRETLRTYAFRANT